MQQWRQFVKPILFTMLLGGIVVAGVYRMLGIPQELFTPIFAISRIVGWSAHRIEEIVNAGKIIRPAYKSVSARRVYVAMGERG